MEFNVAPTGGIIMKRFLKNHIYFGRMASRTNDEFIDQADERIVSAPDKMRWFCGMNDMNSTFICQAL